jgi:hypothetical protein
MIKWLQGLNWETIATVVGAIAALLAALTAMAPVMIRLAGSVQRRQLAQDLELLKKLDEKDPAFADIKRAVHYRVDQVLGPGQLVTPVFERSLWFMLFALGGLVSAVIIIAKLGLDLWLLGSAYFILIGTTGTWVLSWELQKLSEQFPAHYNRLPPWPWSPQWKAFVLGARSGAEDGGGRPADDRSS